MKRRDFLRGGVLGTIAAAGAMACQKGPDPERSGSVSDLRSSAPGEFELDEITIAELQEAMASGRHTARSICESYLERIEAIDRQGPTLRSILEVNPEALSIAEALDRERREKGPRGPLHGVPIVLKDNIDTHDRMTTTAGSFALAGSIPPRDAFVARRLRKAGAVLLAKTNLSEWANFRSTRSSSGWSGRGGQCKNPYALDRNPCGSSSGSGAAIAANLAAVAIGTETDGSIVCPSTANGIVGVKPTVGLVSRAGIIPIAHSQDTAGPMARTVRDAAIVLGALTGIDPRDPATAESDGRLHRDYTEFLDPEGLRGARIGVARNFFGFHEGVDGLMEAALEEMERGGAEIIDPAEVPHADEYGDAELEVLLYEFKADLNSYLAGLGPGAPVSSLEEIIEYNERHREQSMPYFGQELFIQAQAKGPLTAPQYREALEKNHRLSREEGIDRVMDEHRLDALVAPTGGPAWTTDLVNGDRFLGASSTPAAVAGYPNITVPAGFVFGLPVGISFFGRAWSEPVLIRLAYAYEQATRHRRSPEFLPSAKL